MLESLQQNNFLVIGRAGMDLYADPPGSQVELANQFTTALGGSSANIAVAIARQGGRATLATSVSDDAVGRYVLNQLTDYGVDTRLVRTVGGQSRTSLAVVETRLKNCQSIIYRNEAADFHMTQEDVDKIDVSKFGAMLVTGTCLAAEPSRSATIQAIGRARQAAVPIVLDLDYRPYSWPSQADAGEICLKAARMCNVIVGNDEEFATLAGSIADGRLLAEELSQSENRLVVYKMGENGSVAFQESGSIETGIFPVAALKPTGSGDAFLGNLVSALSAGHSLSESLARGSAAAAMVVSKVGCAPAMPNGSELETFMNNHPGITHRKEAGHAHTAF